jgi:GNAT superfamily N-acetyltransferase
MRRRTRSRERVPRTTANQVSGIKRVHRGALQERGTSLVKDKKLGFLITHNGKNIGHIVAEDAGVSKMGTKKVFLTMMEIDEEYQGKGIGSEALKQAEDYWRGLGYQVVELDDRIALDLKESGESLTESFWRKRGYKGRGTYAMKWIGG